MITTTAPKPENAGAFTDKLIVALAECAQYLKEDQTPKAQALRDRAIDLITVWMLSVYQEDNALKSPLPKVPTASGPEVREKLMSYILGGKS
jgi:hypothetical protein